MRHIVTCIVNPILPKTKPIFYLGIFGVLKGEQVVPAPLGSYPPPGTCRTLILGARRMPSLDRGNRRCMFSAIPKGPSNNHNSLYKYLIFFSLGETNWIVDKPDLSP